MADGKEDQGFASRRPTASSPLRDAPTARRIGNDEAPSTFASGEILAARYRILRFIAQGGMGEVYEAEDQELRERVALKTIRPKIAEDERAMERFRREVQLARKVTHPNVSRIFDVAHHQRLLSDGSSEDVTFLTMELLEGESLTERLRRSGRMTTEEALPIIRQIASALQAAHRAGIVHRDFKCSNVMLVPSNDKEVRAVVTDFGLARRTAVDESAMTSISGTGEIVGTPAYIAPEQLMGEKITPAADLYALGVVMYEMVTGKLPFTGDTPLAIAMQRLEHEPSSPREHVADLDPAWEGTILRCLQRYPEDRFTSAVDVLKALTGEETLLSPAMQHKRLKHIAFATVVIIAGVVAFAGYQLWQKQEPTEVTLTETPAGEIAQPVAVRPAVAVLGFKNLSGDDESGWVSTALAEMLTTELSANEKLRTIPGENVARMKLELSLPEAESFAADTLGKIHNNIGTDYVILGSYLAMGRSGQLRIDLRIQNTTTGEMIASMTDNGNQEDFFQLVSRIGSRLREKLGAGELNESQANALLASRPSNPEAARYYSEGLAKMRVFDNLAARDLLQKAIELDPNYALAHSALSEAWSALGYDRNAQQEAQKALDMSANLSREERLFIEARHYQTAYQWDKVLESYTSLYRFFPDNLEYGLRLIRTQTQQYHAKDALAIIEELRKLPTPAARDPRIDLEYVRALSWIPDYPRANDAAEKAIATAKTGRADLILAQILQEKASILFMLGKWEDSSKVLQKAKEIFRKNGDRSREAEASILLVRYEKKPEERIPIYNNILSTYQEMGNQEGMARVLNSIGNTYRRLDRSSEAIEYFHKALDISSACGNKTMEGAVLYNLSGAIAEKGDPVTAMRMKNELLAVQMEIGNKKGVAMAKYTLALALKWTEGNLQSSRIYLEEALSIFEEIGSEGPRDATLFVLGSILVDQGDLLTARHKIEQALGKRNIHESKFVGAQQLYANLLFEEGEIDQAERVAHETTSNTNQWVATKLICWEIVARCLLAKNEIKDAQKAIDQARRLYTQMANPSNKGFVEITAARVLVASEKKNDATKAIKSLTSTLEEANQIPDVPLQFETRLAMGEIEVKYGDVAHGKEVLSALQKDATEKGFLLIARKANAALSGL